MVRVPVLLALILPSCAVLRGAMIVVDPSGGGSFTEIQPALDAAANGDTVLVKPGEYLVIRPLDYNAASVRPKAVVLRSEGGPDVTTIAMSHYPMDLTAVVLFQHGETSASVLEGFTLIGWQAPGPWVDEAGVIVCKAASSPLVKGCRIKGDPVDVQGTKGVYCGDGSNPAIEECTITDQRMTAVYLKEAAPRLSRCTIERNRSMGLYGWGETVRPVIEDCTFRGNGGAAIDLSGNAAPTFRRCTITKNQGNGVALTAYSGGLYEDCIITGNGDGIECDGGASPTFRSSTIAFNGGCGMWTDDEAAPVFENCTIAWNMSSGAAVYAADHPIFRNCIIWGNTAGSFYLGAAATATVDHCCVQGDPIAGDGNIDSDPLFCAWGAAGEVFVDASSPGPGDGSAGSPFPALAPAFEYGLSLAAGSPCRGAGTGGADMGDDLGSCGEPGASARTIHVAAGTYSIIGLSLAANVSLTGAGAGKTTALGCIYGLRTGATLARLTVTGGGTGVRVSGGQSPRIEGVTARGNRYGGFSIENSTPTLSGCTSAGNFLYGICCSDCSPRIENCAVWGNVTDIDTGGICSLGATASPTVINCTIAGNRATRWGTAGVVCTQGGTATVKNTIIWANTPQATCGIDATCLVDRNPLFVSEGACGGRYATIEIDGLPYEVPDFIVEEPDLHLRSGSPAIDAGECSAAPDRDIAGIPRPQGAGCDIGAFETLRGVDFIRGDANAEGATDITDVIAILDHLFLGGINVPCDQAGDANDDGALDITDAVCLLSFLFMGGMPIEPPVGACGVDPTGHDLPCESYPGCQ